MSTLSRYLTVNRPRLQNGYWLFGKPVGYRYVKDIAGGKIMVPDEPKASAVAEALEALPLGGSRGRPTWRTSSAKAGRFRGAFTQAV